MLTDAFAALSESSLAISLCALLVALLLDKCFGETPRFHPLVGFGNLAHALERWLNNANASTEAAANEPVASVPRHKTPSPRWLRLKGALALLLALLPFLWLAQQLDDVLSEEALLQVFVGGFVLYVAIGWQSLLAHARAIAQPLLDDNLPQARQAVSMIVSRDAEALDASGVAKAATESVLENGGDAVFSAIFWFLLAGIPGVVIFRLANTLDAMWGYKNPRFLYFGWAAARLDDLLNLIPARLTALSYALVGSTRMALRCWRLQGFTWKSPNAGPVMAAGAGALNVSLGGAASYHNGLQHRPQLGPEVSSLGPDVSDTVQTTNVVGEVPRTPSVGSVLEACRLVNSALWLWCTLLCMAALISLSLGGSL